MTEPPAAPLSAPLTISFDYTRSLGPVLSQFMTALAQRTILGSRSADGRVHVPPAEYDPVTFLPPAGLVPVGPAGTVLTWSWQPEPREGQPLDRPFAWALIRLDGADTGMLHAVDAGSPGQMSTGMRVQPRWAASPAGHITDIECFEPARDEASGQAADSQAAAVSAGTDDAVTMITTPVRLHYQHTASAEESRYLRALQAGKIIGQRCPACGKVYIPPRGACPVDGVPTTTDVELPDVGTVTTFCVVNVPFQGQRIPSPYVAAQVLLDGADIAFQHLILGCEPAEVRMGMRVRAVWKPAGEWGTTAENISHFEPTGEPDAPYDSYARHL
ncbi:MAG TPA: OB-fold domain-containing protein [Streptosporangiaceae bacterium]|nr:OB-fold domain-containing protein [Streptosporangiaceae bacterium]